MWLFQRGCPLFRVAHQKGFNCTCNDKSQLDIFIGRPTLSRNWEKWSRGNGRWEVLSDQPDTEVTDDDDHKLTIDDANRQDHAGTYRCVVVNGFNRVMMQYIYHLTGLH